MLVLFFGLGPAACHRRPPKGAPGEAAREGPTVIACPDTGCPEERATTEAREGGELRVYIETEPSTLCDLIEHDVFSRWIIENQLAETLFRQDPHTGAISPHLAERVDGPGAGAPDGGSRQLILTLRPGVTWHDGTPLTSADVAFTLKLALDPKLGADALADLQPIAKVETPDPRTVVLGLNRPAPYLKQALAHVTILPEHVLKGKELRRSGFCRAPIGTGPFRFDHWASGEAIVLRRNDAYWGARPHLQQVTFRVVRDRNVAYELYRRGELDVMWRLPAGRLDEALKDARLSRHHLLEWTPRAYYFVVWNTQKGPLADPRVRRALTLLTDRERFLRLAFAGHARPMTGPYALGSPSYDQAIRPLPFDPKTARALLDQAGVRHLKIGFLLTAGSRTVEQLATLLKEDLERAGVELDVETVDFAVQLDRLRRHAFEASSLQWTLSIEQDNYNMFHSSQADHGQNYGGYKSARADALLEKIRLTEDDQARHALDRQLHAVLADEQPYTFLGSPEVQTLVSPRVHGLSPSIDGFTLGSAWVD
jgi:peptide/nickel transport system substrate-binding protein